MPKIIKVPFDRLMIGFDNEAQLKEAKAKTQAMVNTLMRDGWFRHLQVWKLPAASTPDARSESLHSYEVINDGFSIIAALAAGVIVLTMQDVTKWSQMSAGQKARIRALVGLGVPVEVLDKDGDFTQFQSLTIEGSKAQ